MKDTTIKVENVSKKFCKSLKSSMLYGISDIAHNLAGRPAGSHKLRKKEFWAVDNVSFELNKGETLGIIGPNGSGKSTLLKMLNGIFWPDRGKITISGRVGALIEVGAGFHPMLTGRENIYVNGAILGMSKTEIRQKFDSIVEFADIGDFLDTPVKNYSSGMFVRLGFAVAVHCEPDILLVDEVLAVGDVGFRSKCYNKIAKINQNASVILVSHNMSQISRICSKVAVLDKGHLLNYGDIQSGIDIYNSLFDLDISTKTGSGKAKILKFEIFDGNNVKNSTINYNSSITIRMLTEIDSSIRLPVIYIGFYNLELRCVAELNSRFHGFKLENDGNKTKIVVHVNNILLNPGKYKVTCCIYDEKMQEHLAWHFAGWEITVTGSHFGMNEIQFDCEWKKEV